MRQSLDSAKRPRGRATGSRSEQQPLSASPSPSTHWAPLALVTIAPPIRREVAVAIPGRAALLRSCRGRDWRGSEPRRW